MQRQIFGEETYMFKAKQLVEQLFESILPVDGRTNVKFLGFSTPPEWKMCTRALPECTSWWHPRRCRYDNERSTLLSPQRGNPVFPGTIPIGTFPGSIPRGNPVFSAGLPGSIPRGNMHIYNQWTCRGGSTALWASVYEVKLSIY